MSEYIYEETPSGSDVFGRPVDAPMLTRREEIVRCRDCNWFTNSSHYGAYCTNFGAPLHDDYDGYCAWGVKQKEGE